MPNLNYYKTISANMLVTAHDMNFVMGFIKEDEIYSPQHGVSDDFQWQFKFLNFFNIDKILFFSFFSYCSQNTSQMSCRLLNDGDNHHWGQELTHEPHFKDDHRLWLRRKTTFTQKPFETRLKLKSSKRRRIKVKWFCRQGQQFGGNHLNCFSMIPLVFTHSPSF